MGDLRDQLKKANLLSKKDARRLAHEDRVHRKQKGGAAAVDQEKAEHDAELRERREAQKQADRDAQAQRQEDSDARAETLACEELLRREVRRPGRGGSVRWYFTAKDGSLPFLELPPIDRLQLTDGALSIVRVGPAGSHDYGLLDAGHAERIGRVFPERIEF